MIHVVLLSGGSGTRLWPLSNTARSKQFLKVLRDDEGNHVSMVQRVFGQIAAVDADLDVTIATSSAQTDVLSMQVGDRFALATEPERRDTAPAIMLACSHLSLVQGALDDDPVVVMPIDTYADQEYYDCISLVADAVMSNASDLVLLGVKPTYPSEKYGYILPFSTDEWIWPVEEFREKPSEDIARSYIERGGLWNCGVFGFRLGWLRSITRRYVDATSYDEMVDQYGKLPKNSFDYEVVEDASSISVVPYAGTWKDMGTWGTLTEEMAECASGNVWVDKATVENVHAINETDYPLVIAGITDAVVVVTPDGILVSGKEASSHIKGLVEKASSSHPMYERRRWGEYRVMREESYADGFQMLTKELVLLPGKQLSYQRSMNNTKTWVFTSGMGEVVLDGEVRQVCANASVRINPAQKHAVRALTELHFVEVQVGQSAVGKGVERLGYFWREEG